MRKIFTLHLSPELHNQLSALAESHQRSMAGQLRWLIASAEITHGDRNQDLDSENASREEEEAKELLS